jgi:beta-phosphoglucomutase-like phosphatase (HAD superfamily)
MFTVLWDNDGVLVDAEGLYFRATQMVLASIGVQLPPEQFIDISLRQGQSTFKLAAEQGIPAETIACLRTERDRIYSGFLQTEPCLIEGVEDTLRALHGGCNSARCEARCTTLPSLSTNCRNASLLIDKCAARARFAAVFAKLLEAWFMRQAISRTPWLIVASASSSQRAAGVSLPSS